MKPKSGLIFWGAILGMLVGIFLLQYNTPKKFIWQPTFSTYDKQPLGSYVFDDVVSSSLSDYKLVNKTFYQLYLEYSAGYYDDEEMEGYRYLEESIINEDDVEDYHLLTHENVVVNSNERIGILITEHSVDFTETDVDAMLFLVKQGHKVMLCLNYFPSVLCDSINFTIMNDGYFSLSYIDRYAKEGKQRDSLFYGTDTLHPEKIYAVYPHFHPVYIEEGRHYYSWERDNDSPDGKIVCDSMEILVWNKNNQPVVMRLFMGEGELFLVTTPLLFTNYGMLDGDNASYIFRLLSYMKDIPVMRVEAYGVNNQLSDSPLRYFLVQSPLRWALYMTLIIVILCMIFSAKRRQRIIPVVNPPQNQTLRFTQLIGNLYYQKKDYKDMVRKKFLYFCTEAKRLYGLDLQSGEADKEICQRLAGKMGVNAAEIWPGFRELKHLVKEDTVVSEDAMIRNIDRMNQWMNNLYK